MMHSPLPHLGSITESRDSPLDHKFCIRNLPVPVKIHFFQALGCFLLLVLDEAHPGDGLKQKLKLRYKYGKNKLAPRWPAEYIFYSNR